MNVWPYQDKSFTTEEIAQKLLGCLLVRESPEGLCGGYIVETEAYLGVKDQAAHVYGGRRTPRLEAFYREGGIFYIYTLHTHLCLNVITQSETQPEGILIRALEPAIGLDIMAQRRHKTGKLLTNGPGKLTQALGVDKAQDYGSSVGESPLRIDFLKRKVPKLVGKAPRIGIPNKGEWTSKNLRYFVEGNPYVSDAKGTKDSSRDWII